MSGRREPQTDWLPLSRAIFRFGTREGTGSDTGNGKPFDEMGEPEIVPDLLDELEGLLTETAQADKVEIDLVAGIFLFTFYNSPNGVHCIAGEPWALLRRASGTTPNADPRLHAEALFNKKDLVRIADEDVALYAKRFNAVQLATGLVWRQRMLCAFDRAVSAKRVTLYARIQTTSAPLHELPADVWSMLEVVDWPKGTAADPSGTLYYSIHAASGHREASTLALATDEDAAANSLAQQIKRNPDLTRDAARAWCGSAGFKLSTRGFQNRVWPEARHIANEPRRAKPGRKPKSTD